ncbi:MAG: tetratricopeptide repeat protein [Bacteroidia bacterium]|nr:tetratricopeptide repeat protein [Bacteroidia bacterium]
MSRFFILIFFSLCFFSQNSIKKIDYFLNLIKNTPNDSVCFYAYLRLGNEFQENNPDTAIYFHKKAKETAEKIPGPNWQLRKSLAILQMGWDYFVKNEYYKALMQYENSLKIVEKLRSSSDNDVKNRAQKLSSAAWGNMGLIYSDQGNYSMALEYYFRALKMNETIGDKKGQAVNLGNIGLVYWNQGDYSNALEYYFRAQRIDEEIGNKQGLASNLANIGLVYNDLGDYLKALEYNFRALKIDEELGNKNSIARHLGNIGNVYNEQEDYPKAMKYYFRALKLYEEIGNKQGQASNLANIGLVYWNQGNYPKALEYNFHALKLNEEIGNKKDQTINLGNIGALYLQQKKYAIAEKYLKKAEKINQELGTIYYLEDNYLRLSDLCYQKGRYKEAFDYYKEHIKYRDCVMNEENQKALVQKEMRFNFEKEKTLKEREHQKKLELERKEKEKQLIIIWFVLTGLVLVIAFLSFSINRLYITKKQKKIIEKQKKIVEEQKLIVEEKKKLVEQKNKDILDSINYAKRIQNAILPSNAKWKEHLPKSFVLYLPKDIVAGDFYWMEFANNYIYVAAADCTGHGVPGAMVSVVCSNALTKAVLEEKATETDQILNRTRELVIEKLTGEENIRDGMDVCLIRIEKCNNAIQFSGANRPLYIVKSPGAEHVDAPAFELIEIKPDKQPIGRYEESKPFTKQNIETKELTWLYLTTDGYADQFGGEKGKKIGTKQFKELLCDIAGINDPEEQKEKLSSFFKEWKGNEEQMDDVTIIGIKT